MPLILHTVPTFLDIVADDERIFLDTALLVLLTRDIKKNTRRN